MSVSVAACSNAQIYVRSHVDILGSKLTAGHGSLSVVSGVSFQVEVSATS